MPHQTDAPGENSVNPAEWIIVNMWGVKIGVTTSGYRWRL
jgi:hypothetical protein